jgi:hypothetical protein
VSVSNSLRIGQLCAHTDAPLQNQNGALTGSWTVLCAVGVTKLSSSASSDTTNDVDVSSQVGRPATGNQEKGTAAFETGSGFGVLAQCKEKDAQTQGPQTPRMDKAIQLLSVLAALVH